MFDFNDGTPIFLYIEDEGFLGMTTLAAYIDVVGGEDGMMDDPEEIRRAVREHGRFLGGGGAQPRYAITLSADAGSPFRGAASMRRFYVARYAYVYEDGREVEKLVVETFDEAELIVVLRGLNEHRLEHTRVLIYEVESEAELPFADAVKERWAVDWLAGERREATVEV